MQKLGAFVSHELSSPGQKYQAKEDETVGLVGIEEWYEKKKSVNPCSFLFPIDPLEGGKPLAG